MSRLRSLGMLGLAVVCVAGFLAPQAAATEFFGADFESGDFSEWSYVQALEERVSAVKAPVAQGEYAGRFEVQEGDKEPDTGKPRAEVISGEEFEDEDVRYFRILSRVDSWDYGHWGFLWSILDDSGGSPPISLQLYEQGSTPMLWLGHGNGSAEYWEAPLPAMKEWFEVVVRVEFGEEGSLQVWLNGDQQTMANEEPVYDEVDTLGETPTFDKLGINRSSSGEDTAVVYYDDYRITDELFSEPPVPTSIFGADFESGDFSEWPLVQAIPARVSAVENPVAQGTYAGRFEVQEGDEEPATGSQRAEVISGEEFEEGEVRYFRLLSRIDSWDFGHWGMVWQMHDESSGSPPLSLQLYKQGATPMLWLGHGKGSPGYWEAPLPGMEDWFEVVIRVEFGEEGSLRVWLDGEPQAMLNEELIYGEADTLGEPPAYDKLGIYRSSSGETTAVVYHDDYRITEEFFSDPPE